MFIRESSRTVGKKRYAYLTLVESVLTPKGPRQRVILSLAPLTLPKKAWPAFVEMIQRRLAGQQTLIQEKTALISVADQAVERIRRKGRIKASVTPKTDSAQVKLDC